MTPSAKTPPINVFRRIDHMGLMVRSLDRSVAFYKHYFGFNTYFKHTTASGVSIAYMRLNDTVLELVEAAEHVPLSGYHMALECLDLRQAVDYLSQHLPVKKSIHETPMRKPSERTWKRVVFLGPDGEEIELRGPYVE